MKDKNIRLVAMLACGFLVTPLAAQGMDAAAYGSVTGYNSLSK